MAMVLMPMRGNVALFGGLVFLPAIQRRMLDQLQKPLLQLVPPTEPRYYQQVPHLAQ
jgi:hypothetical protein